MIYFVFIFCIGDVRIAVGALLRVERSAWKSSLVYTCDATPQGVGVSRKVTGKR